MPDLPAKVTKVIMQRGDSLAGAFVNVAGPALRLETALPSSTRTAVKPGTEALVDDTGSGTQFEALVVSVASTPATEGEFAGRFPVILEPIAPPAQAVGLSLRIRFPIQSTVDAALIVPVTALNTGTDGVDFVERLDGTVRTRIPVTVGLTSAGLAEVVPRPGSDLPAGSDVVVGLSGGSPQ